MFDPPKAPLATH